MGNVLLSVPKVLHKRKNTLTESTSGVLTMLGRGNWKVREIWYVAGAMPQSGFRDVPSDSENRNMKDEPLQTP